MWARSVSRRVVSLSARKQWFSQSFRPQGQQLVYNEHGSPDKVLSLADSKLPASGNQVLIKFLAAPINPADINMIQGTYGISPELPAIGGNEGVAVVQNPGSSSLQKGDWVIPASPGFGTWRTEALADADQLIKIPNNIPVEYAASISVNPSTAYRLLEDFVSLKPGDVIIQNGANSAVGLCVIQLAKERGIKVVNVVRSRPEGNDKLFAQLKAVGAEIILTEEQLPTPEATQIIAKLGTPKLGLNLVGGKSATNVARQLGQGGILVTYGGMSRQPILVSTGSLIFNDLQYKGFWLSRWTAQASRTERESMLNSIANLIQNKKLKLNFKSIPLAQYKDALEQATAGQKDAKILLKLD